MKLNQKTEIVPSSLINTKEPVLSVPIATARKDAEKWFSRGVDKHLAFERGLKQARRDFTDAAFAFLRCRAAFEHGAWLEFLRLHSAITPRMVQHYIELARHAQDWVLRNPDITPKPKTADQVNELARELILHSPKPLVVLCRELKFMRPFGEYDAVKFASRRLGNGTGEQIEFDFASVIEPLEALCHFGDEKYQFNFPSGRDEAEFIAEVETKLDAALTRVRQIKQHGRVIEA